MGKKCDFLAYSKPHYETVISVARSQFKRRKRAFDELSILSSEDLSQELWCSLLGREIQCQLSDVFIKDIPDFKNYLISLSEIIAMAGRRKKDGYCENLSSLNDNQKTENLFYCY